MPYPSPRPRAARPEYLLNHQVAPRAPHTAQPERRAQALAGLAASIVGGAVVLVLLGVQLAADPAIGVSFSDSPFTDEGWSVMGARNIVLLGRWAVDEWQLFWAQLPFNLAMAGAFEAFGVGILQARVVTLVCSVLGVVLIAGFVGRRFGMAAGLLAAIGMATRPRLPHYGRLALLEPMVLFFLAAGFVLVLGGSPERALLRGTAAGAAFALAIGTKPSAAFAVAGILAGAAVASRLRASGLGMRLGAAVAVIGVAGGAWLVVVLSQPGLIESILQIWPQQNTPDSLYALVRRALGYLRDSDGAIPLTAPLLAGAVLGVVLVWRRWRELDPAQRAVFGAAIGWLILGMAILLIAPNRPNRYVVPMIPALVVLTGFACAIGLPAVSSWIVPVRRRMVAGAAVGLLCVVIGYGGVAIVGRWMSTATYLLPRIQDELARLVTDGYAVEGGPSPIMAMRVVAPTNVARFDDSTGVLWSTQAV